MIEEYCASCKVMGYTTLAHCDQCRWRWAARLIKSSREAWWREQKDKGMDMEPIRAYWLEVRAHDENQAQKRERCVLREGS